jgi:deoxycytidine triphosphate deaminase
MRERQGDQTLLDFDIIFEARRTGLLVPFDESKLKGASYDLRAGDFAILVHSKQEGGYEKLSLKERRSIELLPGQTVVIYSLERVALPPDMKGRLSLRSYWAIKGLYFNGGVIDPGYTGLLFFTISNLGSSVVSVNYGEGLVTVEFVRLDQPAQTIYSNGIAILDIQPDKMPPIPSKPLADLLAMQAQIVDIAERVAKIEKQAKR